MSSSERAIRAMRAALADPPEWIKIKSQRALRFVDDWSRIEQTMAIGTEDERKARIVGLNFYKRAKPGEAETRSATPDAAKRALESVMVMLGDAIVREEYADLLAVARRLEDRRARRFHDEVKRWVQPLLDAKDAPKDLKAQYRELVEKGLPGLIVNIDCRAHTLSAEQVADAISRARSVEGIAAWLCVFSGALDGAPRDVESEKKAQKRMYVRFYALRDKQESERLEKT